MTPAQTALQRLTEKHPDFEIKPVNTIRPPDKEFKTTPQQLVPVDTPLSVIRKHIPRQSDIDKIVKSIDTRTGITDPGTRPRKSLSHFNMLLGHIPIHHRWKITNKCKSTKLY